MLLRQECCGQEKNSCVVAYGSAHHGAETNDWIRWYGANDQYNLEDGRTYGEVQVCEFQLERIRSSKENIGLGSNAYQTPFSSPPNGSISG